MQSLKQQRGMSFWSMLFVVGVLSFFLFLFFKLFPPYMEDFKIKGALESLARQEDIGRMSKGEMTEALRKRFEIDNISGVRLDKDFTIEPRGRMKLIRLRYENVIPLMANISILLEFDHSKEVRASGE